MRKDLLIVLVLGVCLVTDLTSQTVNKIHIEGLSRTRESVVLREVLFKEGEVLEEGQVDESLIRLRNTQLFSSVDIAVQPLENDQVDLQISVQEKWTTIPIFKAGGGGGINYLTIGA